MAYFDRYYYISRIVNNPNTDYSPTYTDLKGIFTSYIESNSNIIEIPISMLPLTYNSSDYVKLVYSLLQEPINNNKVISYIKVCNLPLYYKTFSSIEREMLTTSRRSDALRKLVFKDEIYYTNFGNIYTEDFTPLIFNTVKLKASNTEHNLEFVERPFHVHPMVFTEDNTMTRFIRNKYIKELVNIKTCVLTGFSNWSGNHMPITIDIKDVKNKFISFTSEPKTNKLDDNILNTEIQSYLSSVIDNVTPLFV